MGFDSSFMREAVSLNVVDLRAISESLFAKLGLTAVKSGRSTAMIDADINRLGLSYLEGNSHAYQAGRMQGYIAVDGYARGGEKLMNGALSKFKERYSHSARV